MGKRGKDKRDRKVYYRRESRKCFLEDQESCCYMGYEEHSDEEKKRFSVYQYGFSTLFLQDRK